MAKKQVMAFKVPTKPSTAPKIDTRPSRLQAAITDEDMAAVNSTLSNQSFVESSQELENRVGEGVVETPENQQVTEKEIVVEPAIEEIAVSETPQIEPEIVTPTITEPPIEEIPVVAVAVRGRKTTRKKKGQEITEGPNKYFALNIDVKYKQLLKFLATTKQVTLIELVAELIETNPEVKQMKQLMKGMNGSN
jgi:hypothetical protein